MILPVLWWGMLRWIESPQNLSFTVAIVLEGSAGTLIPEEDCWNHTLPWPCEPGWTEYRLLDGDVILGSGFSLSLKWKPLFCALNE